MPNAFSDCTGLESRDACKILIDETSPALQDIACQFLMVEPPGLVLTLPASSHNEGLGAPPRFLPHLVCKRSNFEPSPQPTGSIHTLA